MRARATLGILLSLALCLASAAQSAQELYQRGLAQEHSRGNLAEAIQLYTQAARAAGKDRSLAAKALLRAAACEEKLGRQTEAAAIYTEIVRAYPEQRAEASMAQDRLNHLRRSTAANVSKVPTAEQTDVSSDTEPLFETYCSNCHNGTNKSGGLDLASLNARNVSSNTSGWENVLRRLRARRDPPANSTRPDDRTYRSVISKLEKALDGAYSANSPLNIADQVTDTEWANRIAGFLWGTAPDASLLEDARNGRLHEPAVLNRHVQRMLHDPKSANLVSNFLEPWLLLNRLDKSSMDPELARAIESESRLFLENQLREDRGVLELWTANYTFVDDRLARHYGIDATPGKGFQRVTWLDANRAGLLGMAGPLASTSSPSRTSPTRRGIYVFSKFFGMDAPNPPANVPPMAENATASGRTVRDRLAAHKVNPSCANCHSAFDALGLALENFDPLGRWRTSDGGATVDASGTFIDGSRFNGPAELRAGLLKYRDAYYSNITQQVLAYALNRKGRAGHLYDYEMPSVRAIVRSAAARDYRWSAIVSGVITSTPFRMKNLVP